MKELEWDFNSSGTDTKIDPKEFGLSIIPASTKKIISNLGRSTRAQSPR